MQLRTFGRTGLKLSVLGFGCGAVGGLMVRGDHADQERTVARALAAGVNYFDTAVQYGDSVAFVPSVAGTPKLERPPPLALLCDRAERGSRRQERRRLD